jgi:hypothetical protein
VKLNPGERSILAGFFQPEQARAAREVLRQAGFHAVQVDQIGPFGLGAEADTRQPGTGAGSQASAVLFGADGGLGDEARVLMAATPDVSGMAGPAEREAPFLLTVVTGSERADEALELVRRYGGQA